MKKMIKKVLSNTFMGRWLMDEPYGIFPSSKIKRFHNKYESRCFIIGNGPSLNLIDLMKIQNEFSFGVNGIFYKSDETGFIPTFYVVEDQHVLHDNLSRINAYDVPFKFFPLQYKRFVNPSSNTHFFNMNTGYYRETSDFYCLPRFSKDCSRRIYCGQNVTMINIQLAIYFGFKEIYLVGMDHDYKIPHTASVSGETITSNADDENHFHPDYFGKGKKWHDPHLDRVERNYAYLENISNIFGVKIYNATVGGKLEVFERVDFESLF